MKKVLQNLVLWNYSRETSVYVIFCLLIVAFIFLTPKSWFESRDYLATNTSRIIVQQADFSPDRELLRKKVRDLSGIPDAEILAVREKKNVVGDIVYEIEIR